jgi:phosphatidylinositol glycan class U
MILYFGLSSIFRYDPLLAFTVLSGVQATFKSYPTVGDAALYHSLLALHPELVSRKLNSVLPGCCTVSDAK